MLSVEVIFWMAVPALILALIAVVWLLVLHVRLRKLFRGRAPEDLQNVVSEIQDNLKYFSGKEKKIDKFLEGVENRLKRSAQHLGIVRFNPYEGVGGEQSFSVAVLDESKNGFVMTGLYGREQSRVYAKPVLAGESQYQLSGEEREAIGKAINANP